MMFGPSYVQYDPWLPEQDHIFVKRESEQRVSFRMIVVYLSIFVLRRKHSRDDAMVSYIGSSKQGR